METRKLSKFEKRKKNTLNKFFIFREMELSYISGGNFQKKIFFLIKKQNFLN